MGRRYLPGFLVAGSSNSSICFTSGHCCTGSVSVHINANREGNGKRYDHWLDFGVGWCAWVRASMLLSSARMFAATTGCASAGLLLPHEGVHCTAGWGRCSAGLLVLLCTFCVLATEGSTESAPSGVKRLRAGCAAPVSVHIRPSLFFLQAGCRVAPPGGDLVLGQRRGEADECCTL